MGAVKSKYMGNSVFCNGVRIRVSVFAYRRSWNCDCCLECAGSFRWRGGCVGWDKREDRASVSSGGVTGKYEVLTNWHSRRERGPSETPEPNI